MSLWSLYTDILLPAQATLMRMEAGGIRVDVEKLRELKGVSRKALKATTDQIEVVAYEEFELKRQLILNQLSILEAEREQIRATKGDTKPLTKLVQLQRREVEKWGDKFVTVSKKTELAGVKPAKWCWLLFDRLNLDKPPRSTTDKGNQKLGKEEFKWLIARYPDVEVLRYAKEVRWHAKRLSTEYAIKVDSQEFTHPSYNIHTTSTCRVSSGSDYSDGAKKRASDAGNLQNIPPICRQIYAPDQEGGWFLNADWSQAQALIGFHLAGEEEACRLIKTGDIHTRNARILADALKLPFDGTKEQAETIIGPRGKSIREDAKPISYGWLFGMSPHGMQRYYGGDLSVWKRVDAAAREAYPRVVSWWGEVRESLEATGKLRNPWGLPSYYYNSYKKASKSAKEKDFREAMGWIVQSCEAMMCLTVLPRMEEICHTLGPKARLVTTTHDSFLISFPQEPTKEQQLAVLELLEREWPQMNQNAIVGTRQTLFAPHITSNASFTLKADLKLGQNWGPHHEMTNPLGLSGV